MGIEVVFQNHASRQSDFRRGKRLGKHDHLGTNNKPQCPTGMDQKTYKTRPKTLIVREINNQKTATVTF